MKKPNPFRIARYVLNAHELKQLPPDNGIEIAVAGFNKDDISLTLEKGDLTIEGHKHSEDRDDYVHRGISARKFIRKFTLSDTMVVVGADIVDGLLLVGLENQIPEEDKPQTIKLGELNKGAKKLLLG